MKGLVRALEDAERPGAVRDAYAYAGVIVVMGLVNFLLLHQVQFMGWRLGLWMRTATEAAIFRKVLRMPLVAFAESGEEAVPRPGVGGGGSSVDEDEEHEEEEEGSEEGAGGGEHDAYHQSITPGLIMNMATTDVDRFQRIGSLIHYLLFAPLDILIVSACGVHNEGWSFLIGIGVLFLLIPAQALMANALQRAGKRASVLTGAWTALASASTTCVHALVVAMHQPHYS